MAEIHTSDKNRNVTQYIFIRILLYYVLNSHNFLSLNQSLETHYGLQHRKNNEDFNIVWNTALIET